MKGGRRTGSGVFQWKLVYMNFRLLCAYFILQACQLPKWGAHFLACDKANAYACLRGKILRFKYIFSMSVHVLCSYMLVLDVTVCSFHAPRERMMVMARHHVVMAIMRGLLCEG